ncbi:MAG TPA: hypothetical protein VGG33_25745 [Polyangia bacterium]
MISPVSLDEGVVEPEITPTERRKAFATHAGVLARAAGLPAAAYRARDLALPPSIVLHADTDALAVFVGDGEDGPTIDSALAYGIAQSAARSLSLVLPQGAETATAIRAAFVNHPPRLWTHLEGTVAKVSIPSQGDALRVMAGGEIWPGICHLRDRKPWVAALEAWADNHPRLQHAHRQGYRAWVCDGLMVLRIQRSRDGLLITTGGGCSRPIGKQRAADRWSITAPLSSTDFDAIRSRVSAGVTDRLAVDDSSYGEQLVQAALVRHAREVGWSGSEPIRDFPVIRPGGEAGLIDLLWLDDDACLHIVTTRVDTDDLMVLQGLDHWIWASANRAPLAQFLGVSDIAAIKLDFIVAEPNGNHPMPHVRVLSPQVPAQLEALGPDIDWEIHRLSCWATSTPVLTAFGSRTVPDGAHADRRPPRPAQP